MSGVVRLGTRASRLARLQAQWVARRLGQAWPGLEVELVPITTHGDRVSAAWQEGSAAAGHGAPEAWQAGAFVRELERALLDGLVDAAVHSLKDVPTSLPEGLVLAAFPVREDPRDVVVLRGPQHPEKAGGPEGVPIAVACGGDVGEAGHAAAGSFRLEGLAPGIRVGTSSLRRAVQLRAARPDLVPVELRGNVDTRLARLREGRVDALVLAAAGLVRLGWGGLIAGWLSPEEVVPAPGQGALAVECRRDDGRVRRLLEAIDDPSVRAQVAAERGFLAGSGAGCRWPVGALAAWQPPSGGADAWAQAGGPPAERADGRVGERPDGAARGQLHLTAFLALPAGEAEGEGDGCVDGWVYRRAGCLLSAAADEGELWEAGWELAVSMRNDLAQGR